MAPSTIPDVLADLSCPSAQFCLADDYAGNCLTYNGTQWSPLTPSNLNGFGGTVSCVSSTFCTTGDDIYRGTSWSFATGTPNGALGPASCVATTFCGALLPNGYFASFDGSTWTSQRLAPLWGVHLSVSCTATAFCGVLSDNEFNLWTAGTAGAQIQAFTNSNEYNDPSDLSCPTSSYCMMVNGSHAAQWS